MQGKRKTILSSIFDSVRPKRKTWNAETSSYNYLCDWAQISNILASISLLVVMAVLRTTLFSRAQLGRQFRKQNLNLLKKAFLYCRVALLLRARSHRERCERYETTSNDCSRCFGIFVSNVCNSVVPHCDTLATKMSLFGHFFAFNFFLSLLLPLEPFRVCLTRAHCPSVSLAFLYWTKKFNVSFLHSYFLSLSCRRCVGDTAFESLSRLD